MKKTILLAGALALALTLAACGSDGDGGSDAAPSESIGTDALEDTSWTLTSYPAGGTGAATAVPASVNVTANFDDVLVSGNGGCNTYSAAYRIDGDTIAVSPIRSTLIACDSEPDRSAIESAYFKALETSTGFTVVGSTLTLTGPSDAKLVFTQAVPVELVGTTWTATGINNGRGGVQSLVAGSTVTAMFMKDGKVSGNATCNTYSGSYLVQGDKLGISDVASTLKACADAGFNEQETAYLKALETVATYSIVDGTLELRDAKGALAASYTSK